MSLAKRIGEVLSGGEVFELLSDVGGGKTTFIKGLAQGLDIKDTIQSSILSRALYIREMV